MRYKPKGEINMRYKSILMFVTVTLFSSLSAANININQTGISIETNENSVLDTTYKTSKNLIDLSIQLANIATKNNELSQQSMLQLSQDIGKMADRINEMADKINIMADKIVETQRIQSQNLETTQKNMLLAQQNIIKAKTNINNKEIVKNLTLTNNSLNEAIEKNNININISKTKDIDMLIEKFNQASPKYRYKYMNVIKEIMARQKRSKRENTIKELMVKVQKKKEEIQNREEQAHMKSNLETFETNMDRSSGMSSNGGMSNGGDMGGGSGGGMGGGSGGGMGGGMF